MNVEAGLPESMKSKLIVILGVTLLLSLAGCSKNISGRYVCAQDVVEFKPDGTLSILDAKSGAVAMRARYKIKGDHISFIRKKGKPLEGTIKGDSIVVEGLPPLLKQPSN